MKGDLINIKFHEMLKLVKFVKGGKALSTDCIPDTFISKRTLEELLKSNDKIKRIASALEREDRYSLNS